MNGLDWRSRAACLDIDPELFFPAAESGPVFEAQVAEAKAVCAPCPVRAECLTYALAHLPDGVAGGATDDERRAMRTGRPIRRSLDAVCLELGLAPSANRHEIAEAGRVLLNAGRPRDEIAARCSVTRRTVDRWAAHLRQHKNGRPDQGGKAVGSRGGNRAPHQFSHTNPLAGTRTEGTRA